MGGSSLSMSFNHGLFESSVSVRLLNDGNSTLDVAATADSSSSSKRDNGARCVGECKNDRAEVT